MAGRGRETVNKPERHPGKFRHRTTVDYLPGVALLLFVAFIATSIYAASPFALSMLAAIPAAAWECGGASIVVWLGFLYLDDLRRDSFGNIKRKDTP